MKKVLSRKVFYASSGETGKRKSRTQHTVATFLSSNCLHTFYDTNKNGTNLVDMKRYARQRNGFYNMGLDVT